jgi:hypothetical protein
MGTLFYIDFPKPKWFDPESSDFEGLICDTDWSPLKVGDEVLIRDPWLLVRDECQEILFYNEIRSRTGAKQLHPGHITSTILRLDEMVSRGAIPGGTEWRKVTQRDSKYGWPQLDEAYYFMDFWLIRREEFERRAKRDFHYSIVTKPRKIEYKCPLCGSRADALFVGCACQNTACRNWRK